MDISTGNVAFGLTCPGILMQRLQGEDLENVRKIKKLQTSFSKGKVTWQCSIGCNDLNVVRNFIEAIDALEELSVLNYEADTSVLWGAIFHHAKSLRSLAIHTPPQWQFDTWTPSTVKQIHDRLPQLKNMELHISLEEAESRLKGDNPSQLSTTGQQTLSVLDELAKIDRLESVIINVNLQDAPSAFAGEHAWNVMGCIYFPPPNKEPCKQLAQQIYHAFHTNTSKSSLKHLELRFPRRLWDDRCQFWTVAYSVHIKKEDAQVKVVEEDSWEEYLPKT